jgi:hypothetical protein
MMGRILCWFGWHKLGKPYLFPHEYEELHQDVLLVRCVRCGALHRLS